MGTTRVNGENTWCQCEKIGQAGRQIAHRSSKLLMACQQILRGKKERQSFAALGSDHMNLNDAIGLAPMIYDFLDLRSVLACKNN
jgi:hypothetical protein